MSVIHTQARSVVLHDETSITLSQNALCLCGRRIVRTETASGWAGYNTYPRFNTDIILERKGSWISLIHKHSHF